MQVIMATDVGNYDGYYYSYHDQPKLSRARELIIIDFHYYITQKIILFILVMNLTHESFIWWPTFKVSGLYNGESFTT